jgi:hypothetical protein
MHLRLHDPRRSQVAPGTALEAAFYRKFRKDGEKGVRRER